MKIDRPRILVTGAKGQLGEELCRILGPQSIPADLPEIDITCWDSFQRFLEDTRPTAVINAAAYTRVDKAEDEPEQARTVNALAVRHIAKYCITNGCPLVQISTDYVFGGDQTRRTPYSEEDPPAPVNVYGATKLEGEQEATRCPRHIIVRTCGLYGRLGANSPGNFVETILQKARQGQVLRVVNDQVCCPSYVPHVARAILFLLENEYWGTYHVVNSGQTTWFDFACTILELAGLDVPCIPISSAEYPARARRPAYSVLDCSKYLHLPGAPPLPPWEAALREYLANRTNRGGSG